MAQIPNSRADTVGDGLNDYFNVNTVLQHVQLLNGAILRFFSDAYTTRTMDLGTNGTLSLAQSATAPAIANAGTIATTAGVARVSPASAVTGIILAAGTLGGQLCLVVNEAAVANSITFDVSGTSNVADGVNDTIPGGQADLYVWDSSTNLWYSVGISTVAGALASVQSATAVATGAAGTIATAGVGVSRVNPAAARTACVLQAGTYPGQMVTVINEAALANSITFAASGTSNVADGVQDVIPGGHAELYIWDGGSSLWYPVSSLTMGAQLGSTQSATAVAIASSGAIATAGIAVSRLAPAGAVTGITMVAGTFPGQMITVVNESTAANTITFNTTPATALVADSATEANIPGLTARTFCWDSGTSLWYRCN